MSSTATNQIITETSYQTGARGVYLCGLCQTGFTRWAPLIQHLMEHEPPSPVWCEKCFVPKIVITRLDHECQPCREATVQKLSASQDSTVGQGSPDKEGVTTFEDALRNMMEVDLPSWGPTATGEGHNELPNIPELKDIAKFLDGEYVHMFSPEGPAPDNPEEPMPTMGANQAAQGTQKAAEGPNPGTMANITSGREAVHNLGYGSADPTPTTGPTSNEKGPDQQSAVASIPTSNRIQSIIKRVNERPSRPTIPELRPIDHRRLQVLFETVSPVKVQPLAKTTINGLDQASASTLTSGRPPIYENVWIFPRDWAEPRQRINFTVKRPAKELEHRPALPAKTKNRRIPVEVPTFIATTVNDNSRPGPSEGPTPSAEQFQKLATLVESARSKRIQTRYAVVETLECSQCDQTIKVAELTEHLTINHPDTPTATSATSRLARFKSLTCKLIHHRQPDTANKRHNTIKDAVKSTSPRIKRSLCKPAPNRK